jgi:hypothetical protein
VTDIRDYTQRLRHVGGAAETKFTPIAQISLQLRGFASAWSERLRSHNQTAISAGMVTAIIGTFA